MGGRACDVAMAESLADCYLVCLSTYHKCTSTAWVDRLFVFPCATNWEEIAASGTASGRGEAKEWRGGALTISLMRGRGGTTEWGGGGGGGGSDALGECPREKIVLAAVGHRCLEN